MDFPSLIQEVSDAFCVCGLLALICYLILFYKSPECEGRTFQERLILPSLKTPISPRGFFVPHPTLKISVGETGKFSSLMVI